MASKQEQEHVTWYNFFAHVTCAYNQGSSTHESKTDQKTCQIQECCNDTWTSWSDYDSCFDRGAGPYKRQRSRQKFVQVPACSQEGKSVQYDYQTQDCSYTGEWGTGYYCGSDLANMIINSANGCRRAGSRGGSCTLLEEAKEGGNINEEASGSCQVYNECCSSKCHPTELGSEEC